VLVRGNAEADIRRARVRKGDLKGIIGLPAHLLYGTGIPACLVVLDQEDALARKGLVMIDASGGFMKDGPKTRLRDRDIHTLVDVFNTRRDVPQYARLVPVAESEQHDFHLNLPRDLDSQTPEDLQDIAGHLQGGIPAAAVDALPRYWAVCPQLRHTLVAEAGVLESSSCSAPRACGRSPSGAPGDGKTSASSLACGAGACSTTATPRGEGES
jgi:type I restriction enzyme M protein